MCVSVSVPHSVCASISLCLTITVPQAEELVTRLKDVVQSEAEECAPAGATEEDRAFERISSKLATALRAAGDLHGVTERGYPDRGWDDHNDMKGSCVGGWKSCGEGCVARGQTLEEADVLVALLAAANLVSTYKQDVHELCYKQRQRARLQEVSLPVRAQRIGVKDNEATKAATVLSADELTGMCSVVYDDGVNIMLCILIDTHCCTIDCCTIDCTIHCCTIDCCTIDCTYHPLLHY